MVTKSTPEYEHAKIFAPIFIGIAIALAIMGSMPVFIGSNLPVSNAMDTPATYTECMEMIDSVTREKYPPTCITSEGRVFEKPLPRVMSRSN